MKDSEVLEAMYRYGGGFVQALARCFSAADADNRSRLLAAFPELWEKYREFARLNTPSSQAERPVGEE